MLFVSFWWIKINSSLEKKNIIKSNDKTAEEKDKEIQSVKDAISNEESTNSNYQEYSKWKKRDQSVEDLINQQ